MSPVATVSKWLSSRSLVALGIFLGLGMATILACFTAPKPTAAPEAGVLMQLPNQILGMPGISEDVSEAEHVILPSDTQFAKMLYREGNSPPVNCEIVLSGADRRSIHRPEACLRGQGWNLKSGEKITVPLKNGGTLDVMGLTIERPVKSGGTERTLTSLYLYWFVSKYGTTPYHWQRLIRTDLDLLFKNQTHRWAYIIVSAPVLNGFESNGLDREQTLSVLKQFIGEMAPKIMTTLGAKKSQHPET